jgi:DNA-binding CsgD family transcriptional regulator
MAALSEADYRGVLRATARLHAQDDPDALAHAMLVEMRALVAVEHLTYNELDLARQRIICVSDARDFDAALGPMVPTFEAHMHEHPVAADCRRMQTQHPDGVADDVPVHTISDFLPRARYQQLGLYRDFYRHFDTEFQMIVSLVNRRGHAVGVALNRKLRDFTDRDRAVMELLRPHLQLAYFNVDRRARLRRLFDLQDEPRAITDLCDAAALTPREAAVMFHVAHGKDTAQIAVALRARPRTIEKHLEHVFAKLGVHSRAAAVTALVRLLDGIQ